jgi:two-component system KDP operon response regulator KdpE
MKMKTIFVVDDDPAHLKIIELQLKHLGYPVTTFTSGKVMLENLSEPPFVIILDHYLREEKTGSEYLTEIRKKVPKVPVIYMTSVNDEETIKDIYSKGAYGYIEKSGASQVRLRTLLDEIVEDDKKNWIQKLFT